MADCKIECRGPRLLRFRSSSEREGERGIDISALRSQSGAITLDPGYGNTGRLHERDHLHRRREGHPPLPRLSRSSNSPSTPSSPRSPTC